MIALSNLEIQQLINELPNWELKDGFLCTTLVCADFKTAFALMTRIAFEAEALTHHPNWENVYNTIHIKLRTHDANGITQNDFDLANRIESLRS